LHLLPKMNSAMYSQSEIAETSISLIHLIFYGSLILADFSITELIPKSPACIGSVIP
jgi:hypothetical protein